MTNGELRTALAEILMEEEGQAIDWERVQDLSLALLGRLRTADGFDFPAEIIVPYLTEFELRRQDERQAHEQQARLVAYLRGH